MSDWVTRFAEHADYEDPEYLEWKRRYVVDDIPDPEVDELFPPDDGCCDVCGMRLERYRCPAGCDLGLVIPNGVLDDDHEDIKTCCYCNGHGYFVFCPNIDKHPQEGPAF